jgi:hypothetical protein
MSLTNRAHSDDLTKDEVRYLRKAVHYRSGLRKTLAPTALKGLNVTPQRAEYLRALAVTFTEKEI